MSEGTVQDVLDGRATWCVVEDDCRAVLPTLSHADAVVTDPPWPNMPTDLYGKGLDPQDLWDDVAEQIGGIDPAVLVVWLGALSDPRFLRSIPSTLPFRCVRWLRYVCPGYRGTTMVQADVAYVYGAPFAPEGQRVAQAECTQTTRSLKAECNREHPTPRSEQHALFLVKLFTKRNWATVDPFCGSGTTGVACLRLGRRFIGIEREPKYAAVARERLRAEERGLTLRDARAGQTTIFDALGAGK